MGSDGTRIHLYLMNPFQKTTFEKVDTYLAKQIMWLVDKVMTILLGAVFGIPLISYAFLTSCKCPRFVRFITKVISPPIAVVFGIISFVYIGEFAYSFIGDGSDLFLEQIIWGWFIIGGFSLVIWLLLQILRGIICMCCAVYDFIVECWQGSVCEEKEECLTTK